MKGKVAHFLHLGFFDSEIFENCGRPKTIKMKLGINKVEFSPTKIKVPGLNESGFIEQDSTVIPNFVLSKAFDSDL